MEIDIAKLTPDVRHLNDMREVLADQDFAKNAPDMDLYYMYRRIKQIDGLVYNITVTLGKMLGSEFNKTKGHVHVETFKEMYTVIDGQAIFLMQKGDENNIEDVYAVRATKGESIIIREGFGHVTINPSETEDLKTGDWSRWREGGNDYSLFEKMQGACYYYTKDGWVKNENYKIVPELRFEKALKSLPEDLTFLKG